jgi:group I intron endonuclease
MIYIYTLSDPISDEVRYIGITKNLKKRYREHIRESKLNNRHKSTWIRSLSELPKIDIIDTCWDMNYSFWEMYYISLFKSWGFKLTNHTNGGEFGTYGYKFSEESRKEKSLNMMGDKNHFYGKKHTNESIIKISSVDRSGSNNSMYGKNHKDESKKKMSILKVGKYIGESNPRARKIYQYDIDNNLIKVWDYAKECADYYGISRGNISACAKNNSQESSKYKTLKGFIFKFN